MQFIARCNVTNLRFYDTYSKTSRLIRLLSLTCTSQVASAWIQDCRMHIISHGKSPWWRKARLLRVFSQHMNQVWRRTGLICNIKLLYTLYIVYLPESFAFLFHISEDRYHRAQLTLCSLPISCSLYREKANRTGQYSSQYAQLWEECVSSQDAGSGSCTG